MLDKLQIDPSIDAIKISDGVDELAINGDGSINVVISATDLDIRDLVNTQDSIAIGDEVNIVDMQQMDSAFGATSQGFPIFGVRQDASGSPVSATGDTHPLVFNDNGELKVAADIMPAIADDAVDAGNPLKIGSKHLATLTALSTDGDRADLISDAFRRIYVNDSPNIAMKTSLVSVGATFAELAGTPLAGRKEMVVQNLSANTLYIGEDNTVTTITGIQIPKKAERSLRLGENINIFAIADGASSDIRVMELA